MPRLSLYSIAKELGSIAKDLAPHEATRAIYTIGNQKSRAIFGHLQNLLRGRCTSR